MLYHLLYLERLPAGPQRVRYITFRTAGASLTALASACCSGPWMIRRLREFQIGQVIRQEGPGDAPHEGRHADDGRAADPDVGRSCRRCSGPNLPNAFIWIAVLATAAFGAIGFADDYLKIVRRSHHGLLPRYKLLWQVVDRARRRRSRCCGSPTPTAPLYNTRLIFPFFKKLIPDLGWLYVAVRACSCWSARPTRSTSPTASTAWRSASFAVAAAAFTALAYVSGHRVFADYLQLIALLAADRRADDLLRRAGRREPRLPLVELRTRPTSSWATSARSALGGALGTVALLIKQELLLPIVGGVFVLEGAVGDHPGRRRSSSRASASSGWRRSTTTSS